MATPSFFVIKNAPTIRLAEILSEFNTTTGKRWENVIHTYTNGAVQNDE